MPWTRCAATAALLLATALAHAQESPAPAETAARSWLALVDSGSYEASLDAAAKPMKTTLQPARWKTIAEQVRGPLGPVVARHLKSATATRTLPGAPDGDYVITRFATAFRNKADAVETVTLEKETDGQLRVAGYFIR